MGDKAKGCLTILIVLAVAVLGIVFIKEILIGWWIFLGISLIVFVAVSLFGK